MKKLAKYHDERAYDDYIILKELYVKIETSFILYNFFFLLVKMQNYF